MDRILERAFAKAYGGQHQTADVRSGTLKRGREPVGVDDKGGAFYEPAPPDVIRVILDAWTGKEYFRLLGLPEPTIDEIGRPLWPCSSGDISRAYRRLSVLVHPDKNPGDDARQAFEALNEAHRLLKDPGRLEEALREAAVRAREKQERAEARASASERIEINAVRSEKTRVLRKEEGKNFQDEIVRQMRKRQQEARIKQGRSQQRQANDSNGAAGSEEEGWCSGGASATGHGVRQQARLANAADCVEAMNGRAASKVSDEDDNASKAQPARSRLRKKPVFI